MREFKSDCTSNWTNQNTREIETVPAMLASQTGGALVITQSPDDDDCYNVTHRGSGARVTKKSFDVDALMRQARRFWRSLPKEARRVWVTSNDPAALTECVPMDCIRIAAGRA